MSILDTFIQHNIESLSHIDQKKKKKEEEEEMKGIQNWRKEVKLLSDDIILYIEIPKDSPPKKLLELISDFSKVAG